MRTHAFLPVPFIPEIIATMKKTYTKKPQEKHDVDEPVLDEELFPL